MTKKPRDAKPKLALRRQTVRRLSTLDQADLAQVASGWATHRCGGDSQADTFGRTSYLC